MRVVDDKEATIMCVQCGSIGRAVSSDIVPTLQSPYHLGKTPMRSPLCTREKHLSVEPIDERRMQVELRLGTKKMLQPIHGAKIQNKV